MGGCGGASRARCARTRACVLRQAVMRKGSKKVSLLNAPRVAQGIALRGDEQRVFYMCLATAYTRSLSLQPFGAEGVAWTSHAAWGAKRIRAATAGLDKPRRYAMAAASGHRPRGRAGGRAPGTCAWRPSMPNLPQDSPPAKPSMRGGHVATTTAANAICRNSSPARVTPKSRLGLFTHVVAYPRPGLGLCPHSGGLARARTRR